MAAEAKDPLGEAVDIAVRRLEGCGAVFVRRYFAMLVVEAVYQPGGARCDVEDGLANRCVITPRCSITVGSRVEVARAAEVALLAGVEAHIATDTRDAEVADLFAVVVVADEIPVRLGVVETVRVDGAGALFATADCEVREDDCLLLRDRAFELGETCCDLGRVATTAEVERDAFRRRAVEHARAAQCEVLECQAQRGGVGKLTIKQE